MTHQQREIFGRFKPSDVLPFIGNYKRVYKGEDGKEWTVNMGSLRYQTFRQSLSCVVCGIEGSVMVLERDIGKDCTPHFNLYAVNGNDMVLMTKDHVRPRAKGGKDHIDNMQTMCSVCNGLKQDREISLSHLRLLRRFHDMFFPSMNLRQIMKALRCIAEIRSLGGLTH